MERGGSEAALKSDEARLSCACMDVDLEVSLCFDDLMILGHSQVLGLHSKVLREAVKAGSSTAGSPANTNEGGLSIPMAGTSSTDWLKVVPFIYPGQPYAELTGDNLEALLVVGDKYDMPDLAHRVSTFLAAHLEELNSNPGDPMYVWTWISLLDRVAADIAYTGLLERCIKVVAERFKYTCTEENMQHLSRRALVMLASVLARSSHFVPNGSCPKCRTSSQVRALCSLPDANYYCPRCTYFF